MRPKREAYARGHATDGSYECTVGIEIRPEDITPEIFMFARRLARLGLNEAMHSMSVAVIEREITSTHPTRAYFIETEQDGVGIQVYQPYGMPRNDNSASLEDID